MKVAHIVMAGTVMLASDGAGADSEVTRLHLEEATISEVTQLINKSENQMKRNVMLIIASLLSILLLTLHVTDDIVRGISKAEAANSALTALVVMLYGTLVLAEKRSGHVIMLLVGIFAAAMPVIHMKGARYPEFAASSGGFFFVWTLWALGGLGGFTILLAARGLWSFPWRRGRRDQQ